MDGVIHIIDPGIVPSKGIQTAVYDVQVIDETCSLANDSDYSAALVVAQPNWGDIGDGTACPMAPPEGVIRGTGGERVEQRKNVGNVHLKIQVFPIDIHPRLLRRTKGIGEFGQCVGNVRNQFGYPIRR